MQANTHILFSQHRPAAKWHIAEPGLSVSVTNVIRTLSQIIWLCVMNSKDTKRFLFFSLSFDRLSSQILKILFSMLRNMKNKQITWLKCECELRISQLKCLSSTFNFTAHLCASKCASESTRRFSFFYHGEWKFNGEFGRIH